MSKKIRHQSDESWENDDFTFHDEDDYFDTRKEAKQTRKLASKLDRSKYKKTDQDKLEKQKSAKLPPDTKNLLRGIVLQIRSQELIVDCDNKKYVCTLRGVLKKESSKFKNIAIVGDIVWFEEISPGIGAITSIEERKTLLSRAENLSHQKEHLIAANVEQVLITVSVINPMLRPTIIDRYLIACIKGNMKPVIVCNKIDLLMSPDIDPVEKEIATQLVEECKKIYSNLEIPFLTTSVTTHEGIEELKHIMHNKVSVFSGQSGTGKSSLINCMLNMDLPIGDTVHRTRKGSHTTTFAQLITIPGGGYVVDTPGIKSFGVWNITKEEVREFFYEIHEAAKQCKFFDCYHRGEAGCKIPEALESGIVSPLRYESYLNLLQSIEQEHLRR